MFRNAKVGMLSLIIIVALKNTFEWLWIWMNSFNILESPYKYVAGFYHYSFQKPLIEIYESYWLINDYLLTYSGYENLNSTISFILVLFVFAVIVFSIYYIVKKISFYAGCKKMTFGLFYFLPGVFCLIFYGGEKFLSWLFYMPNL